jgi:hypothetical protein
MRCLNCGFHLPIGDEDVNVRSCLMCNGFKVIQIPIFKVKERTIKVKVKPTTITLNDFQKGYTLTENLLRNLINKVIPLDEFDFTSYYDSTITYEENKNLIIRKLKELGYWDKMLELGIIDIDYE